MKFSFNFPRRWAYRRALPSPAKSCASAELLLFICTMFIYCKLWMSKPTVCTVTSFGQCNSANMASTKLTFWVLKTFENAFQKLRYATFPELRLLVKVYFSIFNIIFKKCVKWTSIIITRKHQTFLKPFGMAFKLYRLHPQNIIILLCGRGFIIYILDWS